MTSCALLAQLVLLYMKGLYIKGAEKICMWHFSATRPLSATPRWEFVVHSNSTQVLHTNSTKVVHTSVVHTNSTNSTLKYMYCLWPPHYE